MNNLKKKIFIIFLIFFSLILIGGGFLFYKSQKVLLPKIWEGKYWWIPTLSPVEEKPSLPPEIEVIFPPKEIEISLEKEELPAEEVPPLTPELEKEQLIQKGEELILETQQLISKIEKLIEEKEKERKILIEKAIQEARERSSQVKGVYMTEFIASSQNPVAVNTRENIKKLLDETELNGIVIDIKEAYGPNLPNSLKKLIEEFHKKDIWVIARICAFRDASLIEEKPELYLKIATSTATATDDFWKDYGGGYWLDPSSPEVQNYIIEFSKKAIDFGFDELQFDYVRFPTDGNLKNIVYPVYDGTPERYQIIREFFLKLSKALKSYQPLIILSIDLFGLTATQFNVPVAGQRLIDVSDTFDYISFMLYPSHFYGGFEVKEDLERELPALYFPYQSEDISQVVSNHPYQVVYRSILSASDYLSDLDSKAKIRPWLQDFNLKVDTERGIYYDAEKVRAQIKAAEDGGTSSWLLWNPSNIYTEDALSR